MDKENHKKDRYFEAHFKELRDLLLRSSYLAMEAYTRALEGLFTRDAALCEKVVEADQEIDKLEIRIDQACIDILMAHQPVANDLRFVTMAMKINTNLERMGDQAVYIARVGYDLSVLPPMREVFALPELGEKVHKAVRGAIDAFIHENAELARKVRAGDLEINHFHREMIEKLLQYMMENPSKIAQAVEMIFLARALERIADYGKNIANEVIYLVEAVDARHTSLE